MTIVNPDTGEITATYGEVRDSIERAKASLEAAAEEIVWQIEHQAWTTLGYASWNEMREAEYGGAAFMVPRAERPELVARMRRSGLTQQEIADTAGVNVATVSRDLANANSDGPATITNARGQQRPATYTKTPPAPEGEAGPGVQGSASLDPDADVVPDDEAERPSSNLGAASDPSGSAQPEGAGHASPPPSSDAIGNDGLTDAEREESRREFERGVGAKPTRPAPKPERSGEQQNAEENSRTLASSLIFLLAFQHPNQRDTARTEWEVGRWSVPPTNREYVTPDRMRTAARGLLELADEWENTHE